MSLPPWTVGPGDTRYVFVPRLAKPIACFSQDRALLVARSVNVAPKLAAALRGTVMCLQQHASLGHIHIDPRIETAIAALAEWDAKS